MPDPHAKSNSNHKGECNSHNSRGCRTTIQKGNNGDPAITRELCLPGGEEGWGSETSYKPEGPQSIYEGITFEGLHLLPDLLQSGNWMAKNGPKGCLPLDPDHRSFLTYWEQKCYKFTCLPFSLSSVPKVFTKLIKPVVGLLRQVQRRSEGVFLVFWKTPLKMSFKN